MLEMKADPNNDCAGGWVPLHNVVNFHGSGGGKDNALRGLNPQKKMGRGRVGVTMLTLCKPFWTLVQIRHSPLGVGSMHNPL